MAITRRKLLQTGAVALAAPYVLPATAFGQGRPAPGNRITLGFIGTGSHGMGYNMPNFLPNADCQVVAVCDVDRSRREDAKRVVEAHYAADAKSGIYKGCQAYNDFRDVIAREDIDAVMISTPDHWHVIPAIMAAQSGKDVIGEKPMTLTIREGRALADTTRRYGTIFQTSSENRSIGVYHRACELVRNGRIGRLQRMVVGLPAGWSFQGVPDDKKPSPPPEGFDYELWQGQAPEAPYSRARCHWNFRWILDYSGGMFTDWGAHLIDIAQWGNDTEHTGPVEVEGRGVWPADPLYNTATEFDVDYTYANGVRLKVNSTGPSIRFEGSGGWVQVMGWRGPLEASAREILDSPIGPDDVHLYTCPAGEHRNFLDCVKTRQPCYAPAEVGHRSISIAHIGNIAMLTGRKLRWDPAREEFIGDDGANRMLGRPMRAPWHL